MNTKMNLPIQRWMALLILSIVGLLLAGCAGMAQPASSMPTADEWSKIQNAGTIIVGTSADYPPFESYDGNFRLTGFDITLMQDIGQELGVTVEFRDIAFEGLVNALQVGQIDAAIAAISVAPERETQVDFSQIYYVSEGAVLAAAGSDIDAIGALSDVAAYRVAVQQSSIYADRLQDELVAAGLMDTANLFTYDEADHAVRDLQADRVDLVVLDLLPAEKFAAEGGVTLVGQGFARQRYAVAMPKGATELQTQINQALGKLQNEGVIANLVEEYLALEAEEILPLPSPTPLPPTPPPAATATAVPTPTPGCVDSMAFVSDLSYDDFDMTAPPVLQPGESFRKGWRVRNNGTCTWNSSYTLSYAQGNAPWPAMSGQSVTVQGNVAPGAMYDFYFDLVAPAAPGTYRVIWQMHNSKSAAFGDRVWVGITVPGAPTATPLPTPPPSSAIEFKVDRPAIRTGDCATFRWDVVNVSAVYFYTEDQKWQDQGVAGEANRRVCPDKTTNYYLKVVKREGEEEIRQIQVQVAASNNAPTVERFWVQPSPIVPAGQCVNIQWSLKGDIQRAKITRNDVTIWNDAPFSGNLQDCPSGAGQFVYGVEVNGPGGSNRALVYIQVQ